MSGEERLIAQIRAAVAAAEYPGDDNLRNSDEGDEPFQLSEEFRGKRDWDGIDAEFLDAVPDGFSSALSFFSHEAFSFYLPAYLIADLEGKLMSSDPLFHLCHGLERRSQNQRVNPLRYGDYTWNKYANERHAGFTAAQAATIVGYLEHKRAAAFTDLERTQVDDALDSYWKERARQ